MELRHIRYFLMVAEEGNFTRAAERLGIGQPPLSLQIRDLEQELGVQLFHRIPRGAELTEAGRIFRHRVAALPIAAQDAVEAARRAARGEIGELRLGITAAAALNPVVPRLIREFRRERPGIALTIVEANSLRLREDVTHDRLDAAILRPTPTDPVGMISHELTSEPMLIAISAASDPAPDAAALALARLAEMPLILTPRSIGISLHDAALAACHNAGFQPLLGQSAPQIASILSLVAADLGFSLVPQSMRQLALEGVVYKALLDQEQRLAISISVRQGPLSAATAAFVARGRALARRP